MTRVNDTDTPMASARLSRRAMLRGVAAVGASGALGALLAACGGSSTTATNTAAPAATKPASAATQPTAAAASSVTGSAPTTAAASSAAVAATSVPAATPAAAASPAASAGAAKKGGTLKAGLFGSDILSLDPLTSGAIIDREIYYNIYDSLVAIDVNAQIIPALAEKWETPDPKTYILHLRQGVKFHDGTDFNADAVKFNIMRYLTDPKSLRKAEIDTISSVDVMDPYTVKFTLKSAFAPLLATLVDRAGMMLSPTAVQALGPDGVVQKPVGAGTGAFKFVEWIKNDHITVARNPNYWKKDASGTQLPYLDQITYRPIADATVLLTNAQTGDLDAMYSIAGKDVAAVKSGNALVIQRCAGHRVQQFPVQRREGTLQQEGVPAGVRGGARPRPDPQDRQLRRRAGRPGADPALQLGLRPELQAVRRQCGQGEAISRGGRFAGWFLLRTADRLRIGDHDATRPTRQGSDGESRHHRHHQTGRGGDAVRRSDVRQLPDRPVRLERSHRSRWEHLQQLPHRRRPQLRQVFQPAGGRL